MKDFFLKFILEKIYIIWPGDEGIYLISYMVY